MHRWRDTGNSLAASELASSSAQKIKSGLYVTTVDFLRRNDCEREREREWASSGS